MRSPVTREVSTETRVLTIRDNLARHEQELKALGAKDKDLEPLRAAADAVAEVEAEEAVALHRNPALNSSDALQMLSPVCIGPWEIARPSKPARRWAATAVVSWTGGIPPESEAELRIAMLCGLLCLRESGAGNTLAAMRLCASPRRLAAAVEAVVEEFDEVSADDLATAYSSLMGIDLDDPLAKKKSRAMAQYLEQFAAAARRFGV
jgi:hypothetical protein